ncbi:hypothetical protein EYF80_050900 [Liparis tanakae]|uniref:Uncharacterized protein n=1 Tax=Liparis tanakae TaxID=230148 RepID=A0A4Z2FDF3_9TELE|nr:hypothetical protein EYF80_050900 [Liparis tanakae]
MEIALNPRNSPGQPRPTCWIFSALLKALEEEVFCQRVSDFSRFCDGWEEETDQSKDMSGY